MSRIPMFLGVALCAAMLTACPPKKVYPNCDSDETCQADGNAEVCVEGRCVECATDEQCKEGFTCQDNRCAPPTECDASRPCAEGLQCSPAGQCVECLSSGECNEGQWCQAGSCTTRPEGACEDNSHCGMGENCVANRCEQAGEGCNFDPIEFGFNESSLSSLSPETRSRLDTAAACLKKQPRSVTLGGHADERGTEEYNLQLSERRAATIRRYLVDLGVPGDQLQSVGYGEAQPLNPASNEDAWNANRRVEFIFR